MPVPFADLQLQYQAIKGDIDAAVAAVIRDNAFIRGSYVDAFERDFHAKIPSGNHDPVERVDDGCGPCHCFRPFHLRKYQSL